MTGSRWTFPDKRQLWLAHTELARARTLGLGGQVIETPAGFVLIVMIEPSPYEAYQGWSWSSTLRFPTATREARDVRGGGVEAGGHRAILGGAWENEADAVATTEASCNSGRAR